MSNYIPSMEFETDFEGDLVKYTVEPIDNGDFGRLTPFFVKNDKGAMVLRFEDQAKFLSLASELLEKYITGFGGLKDAKGGEIPLEVVTSKFYFMSLVNDMCTDMFSISTLSKDEEKNSEEPSEQS